MTENKRFIIDDCGTLIDMQTRNTYDYVSEVVGLLNSLAEENEQLKHFIKQWFKNEEIRENSVGDCKGSVKMSDGKRFSRFLLDGGFWFDDYVEPVWSIQDNENKDSIVSYLEFKDEYKDICDGVVDLLNSLAEENKELKHKLQQQEMEYATTSHRLAEENQHIKDTIKQAYTNERTQLGRNVLKQLMEAIQ